MSRPVELALLGAGGRGYYAYGPFALQNPHLVRFVAVAEPDPVRRERFAQAHGIPQKNCYESWQELLAQPQLGEGLLNATMDQMHLASTLAAIEKGYHILLEKPMATTPEDCVRLVQAAEKSGQILQICHVMRYAPFWQTLKQIVSSGQLGRIINVSHRENVAYWHMAHSFVRGNWGNTERTSPMILAKCCHDMDILFWLLGSPVKRLSSFGALTHFAAENAPAGAPERCTDGCPAADSCPYYAPRQYLGESIAWPVSAIAEDLSFEGRMQALRNGPYGRCVYHCDNSAVDHQVVAMELENGMTIDFVMQGHSHENVRTMRYDATKATLRASESAWLIETHEYLTGNVNRLEPGRSESGHGGGDAGVMKAFIAAVRGEEAEPLTSARASLESHLMAFAAEKARRTGQMVDMQEYKAQLGASLRN